jgi:3-dehydroquinate synthase
VAGDLEESLTVPLSNIVLVGFMGSGKTEIGRRLAERTGRVFVDTDDIVESEGTTIADIFAAEGERGFRARERRAVQQAARARRAVIATGGGAVLDDANVKALRRSGVVVYLKVGAGELQRRLAGGTARPMLRSAEGASGNGDHVRRRVDELLTARAPVYESVADHVVGCDGLDPDQAAGLIEERVAGEGTNAARSVRVAVEPPYTVRVGSGLLDSLADHVAIPAVAENVCIVSHPRIRRLWGAGVEKSLRSSGWKVAWFTFPAGEESKSLETAARLCRHLARSGFHRDDALVALGGGVVGDLTGFVASTYARGIPFVQVPTTLLAMVDASIGGKTGVNLPQGKNLVGTFHHPLSVVADLDVLSSLRDGELRAGLAEVVKYAFIAEPSLAGFVVRKRAEIFARGRCLQTIVVRCARIKAKVVSVDPTERGLRMILNYGHTLGHALEALGRGKLHHGEAISIGMVYAAAVGAALGRPDLTDEHRSVLDALGLPVVATGTRFDQVREFMQIDKKYKRGVRMVVLSEPGVPEVVNVKEKVLRQAWDAVAG